MPRIQASAPRTWRTICRKVRAAYCTAKIPATTTKKSRDSGTALGHKNCRVPKSSFVSGVRFDSGLVVPMPKLRDSIKMSTPNVFGPELPYATV